MKYVQYIYSGYTSGFTFTYYSSPSPPLFNCPRFLHASPLFAPISTGFLLALGRGLAVGQLGGNKARCLRPTNQNASSYLLDSNQNTAAFQMADVCQTDH